MSMLVPNFTSFSAFLSLVRKLEVFSFAIGVNCDKGANFENPWDSKASYTVLIWKVDGVQCVSTALHSIVVRGFLTTNKPLLGCKLSTSTAHSKSCASKKKSIIRL